MPQVVDWIAQSYTTNSPPLNASRCVNMFAEQEIQDAKSKAPVGIFMHPGTSPFASLTGDWTSVQAFDVMGGEVYALTMRNLYKIDDRGNATWLGPTQVSENGVSVANNGETIVWVDGYSGWSYSAAHGVNQINDPQFYPANTVVYYDTYFAFDRKGTQQFFLSPAQWDGVSAFVNSGDTTGKSWTVEQIASKEATSDLAVALTNSHEQLFVCGEKRIEVWYDAGNAAPQFPLQRSYGALIQRGLIAPYALVLEDNTVFFLGDDLIFYRLNGFVPERQSNHAIEAQWQRYAGHQYTRAFSYTLMGHKFIVLNFPIAMRTWVLDLSTKRWHERESWIDGNADSSVGRWRVNCVLNNSSSIESYPEILFGDWLTPTVAQLNTETFTEFGSTMRALLIGPPIHNDRRRVFLKKFEIDVESGVGEETYWNDTTTPADNPLWRLSVSDDGGRTWSTLVKQRQIGRQGEYTKRLRWLKMGQSRQRLIKLECTDAVRRNIVGVYMDLSQGMA